MMSEVSNRAVLTIAIGNPLYVKMAANLARSFYHWHQKSDIQFFLATDLKELIPPDLNRTSVIEIEPGQFGQGFSPKLHLDKIAPAAETLFLDADCLCVGALEPVFESFVGRDVGVVGREESEGALFGDIATRCRAIGVPWTVRFCGGLYYLRKGQICDRVFHAARQLEGRYDELGINRLRGVPNEEPLIGLGMALNGQRPLAEDGSVKAEPMFFSADTEIDVFAGRARLFNHPRRSKPYPEWHIPTEAHPTIVHFNASFAEHPPYTVEAIRLERVMRDRWPLGAATLYAKLTRALPFWISRTLKNLLRPIYRFCFGVRAVKPSERLYGPGLPRA